MRADQGLAWWLPCQFSPWREWKNPSQAMFWLESSPGAVSGRMWAMELMKHCMWRAKTSRAGPIQKKPAQPRGAPASRLARRMAHCQRVKNR